MNYLKTDENEFTIINGSPRTLFLYNQAFDRDLLFDLNEAFSGDEIINTSLSSKILWALCLTANKNELPYHLWNELINYKYDPYWKNILISECNTSFGITIEEQVILHEKPKTKPRTMTATETAITILVNSKRMGLTFDELDTFTMNDYINFSDIYSGSNKPQKADQQDIDNLFM